MGTCIIEENFFAPATTGPIDALIAEYNAKRAEIEDLAATLGTPGKKEAVGLFIEGYAAIEGNRFYYSMNKHLFDKKYAIAALNSSSWSKALKFTDVMDYMPSKRRNEWHEQIHKMETPDFEVETVKETLASLMNKRMGFLAEMVDGIFTGLSGEHVTNRPEGFGKRMIIDNVYNMYYAGHKAGLIHDMRCIIAKFMGRDQPNINMTNRMLDNFKLNRGQWHNVDAGAFRIRVYKRGTAHLEINPEISYRLNQILAHLHPMAIPAPHRRRPNAKRNKTFQLIEKPVPFTVLAEINEAKYFHGNAAQKDGHDDILEMGYRWKEKDKHLRKVVDEVMQAIGGAFKEPWSYVFEYNAKEVIRNLLASGVIPDSKSHQYYPTPDYLAKKVVEMAEIEEGHKILEPSAGQGGIADHLPVAQTHCVEISPLNCSVLESKGLKTEMADFLTWQAPSLYDRVLLNPPFSEGRALDHINRAASLLSSDGRIVAILPASFHNKDILPDMDVSWSSTYANEFTGTSASVVIMVANNR